MRGYFWTNMYLSPIQKGIQTAHCITKIMGAWSKNADRAAVIQEYADNHMTKIVFDGGNSASLWETWLRIVATDHEHYNERARTIGDVGETYASHYPMEYFKEDEESLNGALTCVGIILPEKVYNFAAGIRNREYFVKQGPSGKPFDFIVQHANTIHVCEDFIVDISTLDLKPTDIALALEISRGRLA